MAVGAYGRVFDAVLSPLGAADGRRRCVAVQWLALAAADSACVAGAVRWRWHQGSAAAAAAH